jgi:hypothetical protein
VRFSAFLQMPGDTALLDSHFGSISLLCRDASKLLENGAYCTNVLKCKERFHLLAELRSKLQQFNNDELLKTARKIDTGRENFTINSN